jgi:2-polyprenyl-6-methoxyphenol hydroxylase-like FAD-dependent oxidoreductase
MALHRDRRRSSEVLHIHLKLFSNLLQGLFCNRKDLCEELRRLALGKDGMGQPVNLRRGEKVVACNPDDGTLTLEYGEIVHADLVLGGDGIGVCLTILGSHH